MHQPTLPPTAHSHRYTATLLSAAILVFYAPAHGEESRDLAQYPEGCLATWPQSLHGRPGHVRVELKLSPQGQLLDSRIQASSGEPAFENAALDTVQHCRFKPNEQRPASGTWHRMEFHWQLEDESTKLHNIELFQDARNDAERGNKVAQYNLADMYALAIGTPRDEKAAFVWLQKAAEAGYAQAQGRLCLAYRDGASVDKDLKTAIRWCQAAAEQGWAEAQTDLALFYYDGNGVAQNYATAVAWYEKAANAGHAHAQARLAQAYAAGIQVKQDAILATQWYQKAAEQNHRYAQHNLAIAYYDGKGVPEDKAQAQVWMRKAARQGLATSQYVMGNFLINGSPADQAEAVLWYQRAANQGNAAAEARLAQAYEMGQGRLSDTALAFDYFKRAAGKSHLKAMRRLVQIYENGELGQAKNEAEAAVWQARLAELSRDGNK